tara:strand:- start:1384 stop:1602 length:219 start_codon:yes stop_codon:yes gene_type:complete
LEKLLSVEYVPPRQVDLDARAIVPISDEEGGISLYISGKPAYYIFNDEWFEAVVMKREKKSGCDTDHSVRVS